MFCELEHITDKDSTKETYDRASEDNTEERKQGEKDFHTTDSWNINEGDHSVVKDNGDSVIEKRLSKDEEVESNIDVDLLEDGKDGNRVHSRDEAGEYEAFCGS